MTTPTISDAVDTLAAELRLAAIFLILPVLFDAAVIYLAWRLNTPATVLAMWAHPAGRLVDRIDLRARP